jgi:hypothetical protein
MIIMKLADKLLKRAESFEKLAVYGDRRSFLKAIAQDRPGMPSGPFKDPESNFESKYSPEIVSHQPTGLGMLGLTDQPKDTPQIANTLKNKVYPAYQSFVASNEPTVNEAHGILQQAEPLLVAGKPWLKIQDYNTVSSKLQDILMKLNAKRQALLTEPKIGKEGLKIVDDLKDIKDTSTKVSEMHSKLFSIYNKLSGGIKEKF